MRVCGQAGASQGMDGQMVGRGDREEEREEEPKSKFGSVVLSGEGQVGRAPGEGRGAVSLVGPLPIVVM